MQTHVVTKVIDGDTVEVSPPNSPKNRATASDGTADGSPASR